MLTSILNDNDDLNGPNDSKRKTKFDSNYNKNKKNENEINNKNNQMRKNIIPKKKKFNINNEENIYINDINNNINDINYYNYKSEPNYNSSNSNKKQKNNLNNNNINYYPYDNNHINNFQEDTRYTHITNKSKYSNNNINIGNETNKNIINNNNDNLNNKHDYNLKIQNSINSNPYYEENNNINNNVNPLLVNSNNDNNNINNENNEIFPIINYEIKDSKQENISKNEYYINYVTLNREGFENIRERNYSEALIRFQKCYEISKNYIKDDLKQINSLINVSICQYYNGNFSESYTVINKAKIIYDSLYLQDSSISNQQKLHLTIKLFLNSSLNNLSMNNCKESQNDILYLISIIRKEPDIEKQLLHLKVILRTLFKLDSLVNYDYYKNNINDNKGEDDDVEENLMKGFIQCLKENNISLLMNNFKEAAQKYKQLNDGVGYYFSLFYHYLILYDIKKNNFNENEMEEIKKKISLCNDKLIGTELNNQFKEKDVNVLLNEFMEKVNCACEIYQTLEKFEKELNNKFENFNITKSNINLSEDENNFSYSHVLDKSHFITNEKINSPIFVKLLLGYSLNFLKKQKKLLKENNDLNNQKDVIDNYNTLIKEVKIMKKKIEAGEIIIDNIQIHQLDKDIINSLKQLFDNLIYIRNKTFLYSAFHKYHSKILQIKNAKNMKKISKFLEYHSQKLLDGMNLIKINYKSNGFKTHFYDIDEEKLTFNIREDENDNRASSTYHLINDIIKVQYGIRSRNLRKKLYTNDKEKDIEMNRLLIFPWRFLSLITRSRSIDFYCDDEQIDNMFYGLKSFFVDYEVPFKINTTNYFILTKLKMKLCVEMKKKYLAKKDHIPKIVKGLLCEKGIQNISFAKLILIFNKFMNNK